MLKFKENMINKFFLIENVEKMLIESRLLSYEMKRKYDITKYTFEKFKEICEKLENNSRFSPYYITIEVDSDVSIDCFDIKNIQKFWILKAGDYFIYVNNLDLWFELKPSTDFQDWTIAKLNNPQISSEYINNSISLKNDSGVTYNEVVSIKDTIIDAEILLAKEIEEIKKESHEKLEKLKEKLEKAKNEMEIQKDKLMAELRIKEDELKIKSQNLKKEILILDAKIYDLKSYFGESYELIQIRSGKDAPTHMPFVISQKLRFLNEDLPILVGLYNSDIEGKNDIIEALKYSDKLVEYFCQTDKSIMFFRLSRDIDVIEGCRTTRRDSRSKGSFNSEFFIEQLISERGHDFVGFLVNNGENLYMGVLDEGHRIIVDEDIFMDINTPISDEEIQKYDKFAKIKFDKEKIARKFMFSLIQGLIDNKKIISFTNPVNLFNLPSEIIFSSALGRIGSKEFGTFVNLKKRINPLTRMGDSIFMVDLTYDKDRINQYFNKVTPDFEAPKGILEVKDVRINSKGREFYVNISREKLTSYNEQTNSKYLLDESEFINLEYLNSKWIEYFISNKDVDKSSSIASNFYQIINIYLEIKDYLTKREEKEYEAIVKYLPNLGDISNWQVLLSEWKLQQKSLIREITDFQAKRFVKSLNNENTKSFNKFYLVSESENILSIKEFIDPLIQFQNSLKGTITAEKADEDFNLFLKNEGRVLSKKVLEVYNETINKGKEDFKNNKYGNFYRFIQFNTFLSYKDEETRRNIIRLQDKTISNIMKEMETIKRDNNYEFWSKNELEYKIVKSLLDYSNSEAKDDDDGLLKETLKFLVEAELKLKEKCGRINMSSSEIRFFKRQNSNTNLNLIEEEKIKNSNELFIETNHEKGVKYYNNIAGYYKGLIPLYFNHILISLLMERFYVGITEINNYPYYQLD